MKLIAFSVLVATATADMAYMSSLISSAVNEEVIRLASSGDEASSRDLSAFLGANLENIDEYGCWCYFDEDSITNGRGSPVDTIDRHCKVLSHGYQCAILDAEAASITDCVPWEQAYNAGISFGLEAIKDTCESVNTDLCAQFACNVEGVFTIQMINAFLTSGSITPDFKHPVFDHVAGCPVNGGTQTDQRDCCGFLPTRFPYKPVDRECCGPVTFDPSLQVCCPDNKPAFSCV